MIAERRMPDAENAMCFTRQNSARHRCRAAPSSARSKGDGSRSVENSDGFSTDRDPSPSLREHLLTVLNALGGFLHRVGSGGNGVLQFDRRDELRPLVLLHGLQNLFDLPIALAERHGQRTVL